MESRLIPNLHFAGECLDYDGITGGFNFQVRGLLDILPVKLCQNKFKTLNMISNQFYLFLFLIFFQLAYSKVNNPDPKRFLDSFETFKKLDQQKDSTTKKSPSLQGVRVFVCGKAWKMIFLRLI